MTAAREAPLAAQACVLLSGGLDSTAALHWAAAQGGAVRAVAFDYGQPARDHELTAAGRACRGLGVAFTRLALADTLHTGLGLLAGVVDHQPDARGLHPAFVPGRNAVFLTVAAAHAASWWTHGNVDLVVGANGDDRLGFPDCRGQFFAALGTAIRCGYAREIRIQAPFLALSKGEVVAAASAAARVDLARSWSCYRREGPCGACSPCVLRRAAFEAAGLADQSAPAVLHGGDPHRERRR